MLITDNPMLEAAQDYFATLGLELTAYFDNLPSMNYEGRVTSPADYIDIVIRERRGEHHTAMAIANARAVAIRVMPDATGRFKFVRLRNFVQADHT